MSWGNDRILVLTICLCGLSQTLNIISLQVGFFCLFLVVAVVFVWMHVILFHLIMQREEKKENTSSLECMS